ncbi:MAG: cytochrome C oxidase subunit IV family protein [Pseudonocardia sp.]|jgi:heme/copper-type cytochrome/quinol oxidase subunit 4
MVQSLLPLLRNRISVVWGVLIAATLLSWWLGTGHGFDSVVTASVSILVVAFVKVRLVGLYFMELRDSPLPLRAIFEAYCLVACGVVIGMFLLV